MCVRSWYALYLFLFFFFPISKIILNLNWHKMFSFSKGQKGWLASKKHLFDFPHERVYSDTHSFHYTETNSLRLSLCFAFQSNFHFWHHDSAYLPISLSVPEWVICKAMFTSTLRRFTQERACQIFELSVRCVHKLAEGKVIAILSQLSQPAELLLKL